MLKPPRVTDHDIPARGEDSGAEQAYASLKAPAQGRCANKDEPLSCIKVQSQSVVDSGTVRMLKGKEAVRRRRAGVD